MRFFNFIKEHHRIGPPADCFGQISTLIISHITWRRSNQPGNRVFLHVLRHIYPHHGLIAVKNEFGKSLGQLGFSHTGWAHENKGPDRTIGILKSGSGPSHSVGYGFNGLLLPDHPLAEPILHVHKLFPLSFQHSADRYSGPSGNDLGDVFIIHFFFQHLAVFLKPRQVFIGCIQVPRKVYGFTVSNFSHPRQVPIPLGLLFLSTQQFLLFLYFTNGLNHIFFILPVDLHGQDIFLHEA